jgi:hypothetical protein
LDNTFNNSAMVSLNLASNNIGQLVLPEGWQAEDEDFDTGEGPWIHTDGRRVEHGMPEGSTPVGVIALADIIPAMGAISSVNLLKNHLPMEQAEALASILKEHPTLKSLCGNSGEETELDMRGKEIGAEGAIMLAPEIANGAMSVLNLADNAIGGYYNDFDIFIATPEGMDSILLRMHVTSVFFFSYSC